LILSSITPEDLVAKYTQPLESGNEFEVYFPGGEPLKCWFPTRPRDIHGWKESLSELWKAFQSGAVPPQWKEALQDNGKYIPPTWDECVAVSTLTYWTGPKPEDKINQLQAIQLLRAGGGYVCMSLVDQIEAGHQAAGFSRFKVKVEEEKKDSNTTTTEDSFSDAVSNTSESTPTV
jgi:hypothetical protein